MENNHLTRNLSGILHPNWIDFIKYCKKIEFGEIVKVRIQDGIPIIAEEVKKKINFSKKEGQK